MMREFSVFAENYVLESTTSRIAKQAIEASLTLEQVRRMYIDELIGQLDQNEDEDAILREHLMALKEGLADALGQVGAKFVNAFGRMRDAYHQSRNQYLMGRAGNAHEQIAQMLQHMAQLMQNAGYGPQAWQAFEALQTAIAQQTQQQQPQQPPPLPQPQQAPQVDPTAAPGGSID